jgi:hypothetical protein
MKTTMDYEAYGEHGVIKSGTVEYELCPGNEDEEVGNFMEAIVEQVGEDVFENEVCGVRGV